MSGIEGMGIPARVGALEIDLIEVMNSGQLSATPYREEFEELLGDAFVSIQQEDSNAKKTKRVHQRHRLAVLLDILRLWEAGVRQRPPIVPLAAVSEIAATLKVFKQGQRDDLWPNLVRSLTSPTNYAHTVVLLSLALYLRDVGAEVRLQRESNQERCCDLVVDYGTAGSLNLEVKTPRDLQWQVNPLLPKQAKEYIRKQFSHAGTTSKGQLPPPSPVSLPSVYWRLIRERLIF